MQDKDAHTLSALDDFLHPFHVRARHLILKGSYSTPEASSFGSLLFFPVLFSREIFSLNKLSCTVTLAVPVNLEQICSLGVPV